MKEFAAFKQSTVGKPLVHAESGSWMIAVFEMVLWMDQLTISCWSSLGVTKFEEKLLF